MAGKQILLLLLLPLLFLDGVHLQYSAPQAGIPWIEPSGADLIYDTGDIVPQPGIPWSPSNDSPDANDYPADSDYPAYNDYPEPDVIYEVPVDTAEVDYDLPDSPNSILGYICPQPSGNFKYADRCDAYIQCNDYVAVVYLCPDGLQFNPYSEWLDYPCEDPSIVRCEEPSKTVIVNISPPYSPNVNFTCPDSEGYYKNGNDCKTYIECKDYVPLVYNCSAGLYFNKNAQWIGYPCANASVAQCEPSNSSTAKPITNNYITYNYVCPQPYGYFKQTGQKCGEFVECKNNVPRTFTCPSGYNYNPNAAWTQYPCANQAKVQCRGNIAGLVFLLILEFTIQSAREEFP
ncbi:protein obstructor-E-like [Bicyclus anynana]|uniref:Protein obstructor-E-like n=1 Tax=Bicyclus anynana TaxID=110368 RepID=A0ABM3LDW9_BICAN|nr:protein obstructor-E-like [Bicyclus anynana]